MSPTAALRPHPDGSTLSLRVQPGARKSTLLGPTADGAQWRVAVAAPPVDGSANQALLRLLASHFSLSRSSVRLLRGEHSRDKVVLLRGLGAAQAEALLPAVPPA